MSASCVLDAPTAPLRVIFKRVGDRFAHTIEWRNRPAGDEWAAFAASVEGTADEVWPASPPFQELHIERYGKGAPRDGSPVAFLVGCAGKSHWSASITFAGGELVFDVACRIHAAPARIGSVYRCYSSTATVRAEPPAYVTCSDSGSAGPILIAAAPTAAPLPCTVRWRYRVVS